MKNFSYTSTYTLSHKDLTEDLVLDYSGTETAARAWASMTALRDHDVVIGASTWEVTST